MIKRKLTPFGSKVKDRLIERNMTQKDLAEKVGTSAVYLSMVLHGQRSGQKYLRSICEILDLEMPD